MLYSFKKQTILKVNHQVILNIGKTEYLPTARTKSKVLELELLFHNNNKKMYFLMICLGLIQNQCGMKCKYREQKPLLGIYTSLGAMKTISTGWTWNQKNTKGKLFSLLEILTAEIHCGTNTLKQTSPVVLQMSKLPLKSLI